VGCPCSSERRQWVATVSAGDTLSGVTPTGRQRVRLGHSSECSGRIATVYVECPPRRANGGSPRRPSDAFFGGPLTGCRGSFHRHPFGGGNGSSQHSAPAEPSGQAGSRRGVQRVPSFGRGSADTRACTGTAPSGTALDATAASVCQASSEGWSDVTRASVCCPLLGEGSQAYHGVHRSCSLGSNGGWHKRFVQPSFDVKVDGRAERVSYRVCSWYPFFGRGSIEPRVCRWFAWSSGFAR
jgi:hypothetical protein